MLRTFPGTVCHQHCEMSRAGRKKNEIDQNKKIVGSKTTTFYSYGKHLALWYLSMCTNRVTLILFGSKGKSFTCKHEALNDYKFMGIGCPTVNFPHFLTITCPSWTEQELVGGEENVKWKVLVSFSRLVRSPRKQANGFLFQALHSVPPSQM